MFARLPRFRFALAILTGLALHLPTWAATLAPLQAVASVDLARYMGGWYQVAFYPNSFQKQCVANTTAQYSLQPDGTVTVVNTCLTASGTPATATGQARVKQPRLLGVPTGPGVSAKLEVRFAPNYLAWLPFVWAPYWVIQLADDYRYSVVSEPSRTFLWILSRSPQLAADDQAHILSTLTQQGFDTTKLVFQPQ